MKQSFLSLLSILVLSSCAVHSGMMTGNASIANSDFQIIGLAVGQASTTQIFGIGGLKKDALTLEAKRNLYENNPLKHGQALANVTVDYKRSYFPFVSKTEAIVSGEIIDFNVTSESSTKILNDSISIDEGYSMFLHKKDVFIAKELKHSTTKKTILYENNNGIYKIKKLKNSELYYPTTSLEEFKINNEVLFLDGNNKQIGIIIATNSKGVIIEYDKSITEKAFTEISYTNLKLANRQQ